MAIADAKSSGQIMEEKDVFDKALALINGLDDGEIVGLEPQGEGKEPYLRHWDAEKRVFYTGSETVQEYGIQNLHKHELSRVGVSQSQYEEACRASA